MKKKPKNNTPRIDNVLDLRPKQAKPSRLRLSPISKKTALPLAIIILFLVFIFSGLYFYQNRHSNDSGGELSNVTSRVSKLILLPKDEQPTLATVEDKTKLKDKFLALHAEDGDKVLIYTKSQIVIIYRPSVGKIAAVGSVTADPALAEAKGATITILDGSGNAPKTQTIMAKVKSAYPDMVVTDGGKTSRQDFPNTVVIDNTQQKDNLLFALIDSVSGQRGVLPTGVERSPTDMMIIVGKD